MSKNNYGIGTVVYTSKLKSRGSSACYTAIGLEKRCLVEPEEDEKPQFGYRCRKTELGGFESMIKNLKNASNYKETLELEVQKITSFEYSFCSDSSFIFNHHLLISLIFTCLIAETCGKVAVISIQESIDDIVLWYKPVPLFEIKL
ncbi:hypothetical protein BpHYR1_020334 [Brachionus plicatilis]|uniref:Uncharacterized protein n=1 Tax=Brachionus plicatilis TaxID=10195 RepID=A0A3M7P266_BRAPC|nr:hypothetical protein BpHYR1_020334 [Brachionus plicatilis]